MVPEKQMKQGPKFTSRQIATAAVTAIIFLIVIWQVIGMLGGGSSAPAPAPVAKGAGPAGTPPPALTPGANPAMAGGMAPPPEEQQQVQPSNVRPSEFLAAQQEAQKNYLNALNQLQMLKIEKEIEETNQAIATAKLATASANKNIGDLLAKPVAPPPPPSAYANQLEGSAQLGGGPTSPPPAQPVEETSYIVISVSMEMNKWSAVIGNKGMLYNVSIGDVLPADGSTVVDINKDGVVLKKGNVKRKVSLVSSI